MRIFSVIALVLTSQILVAAPSNSKSTNLIGIGQGISSPTLTSTVNFSSGYTAENPTGTLYQSGVRLTAEYDSNDTNRAYGAELGYGSGDWGIAAGHRKSECTNCTGVTSAAGSINFSDVGIGLRASEKLYSLGLLFNVFGANRFGLMGESNSSGGSGNGITSYGLGYSHVGEHFTFSIDASTRSFENKGISDSRTQVTPGIMFHTDIFQVSINDKITLNKDKNNAAHDDRDHDWWFGLGLGGDRGHLAFYADYVNEFAFAGSLFF